MTTVSRRLPEHPHLDIPRRLARQLLEGWRQQDAEALDRIQRRHPRFEQSDPSAIATASFRLADAQLVIAREYGFAHWTQLKQRIEANRSMSELARAIGSDDRAAAVRIVEAHPHLLHVPVVSGDWGPPMSHAANLGHLDVVAAMASMGARDTQHAFDRALLQGQIECARWLHQHGATLAPGLVMGTCETLDVAGFRFLLELGGPLTDERGNRLAPLALVLGTYTRNPGGKHAILEALTECGHDLPDTPIMAFHRGDVGRLAAHVRRDSSLLARRFTLSEIYPAELGCGNDGGLHWTPLGGATLLHLAIDFEEREIFDWLLRQGADVNARATVDAEGFGGHTPLFQAVLSHPGGTADFARGLLLRGARADVRASLRKFLDWCETPRWHEARDVTAAEWANGFPERRWINTEALRVLEAAR